MLPDFEEVNKNPKPRGTYDLFITDRRIFDGDIKTSTVKISQWITWTNPLTKSTITEIRRYKTKAKFKVSVNDLQYQIEVLKKVVDALNQYPQLQLQIPTSGSGKKVYRKLSSLLDEIKFQGSTLD